jgi:hypothetical protein
LDWGCGSSVEGLPSISEDLDSSPSTTKKKKKRKEKEKERTEGRE